METEQIKMASTKSRTVCHTPIGACLKRIEERIGSRGEWSKINDPQIAFFDEFYRFDRESILNIPEIESIIATDAGTINAFLKQRGFRIKLAEFTQEPPRYSAAAVLNLLIEWVQQGTVTTVRNGQFPAFRLPGQCIEFFKTYHDAPLAIITAKNGDKVHIMPTEYGARIPNLYTLTRKSVALSDPAEYGGIIVPMVSYDAEEDLVWLKGTSTLGDDQSTWEVEQAVQQTKFRMNEVGARVESAAAVVVRGSVSSMPLSDMVVDEPFLVWITRKGFHCPLFIGYFTEEMWMRPEKL